MPSAGTLAQRLRIATGLVLFTYVATHLGNHALGLVSLETMQEARSWRLAVTRSWPGQFVLIASALTHLTLGISKFLERRTLRISAAELTQLCFGLMIPLLLMRHIIAMRGSKDFFGIGDGYTYALWVMWPDEAWQQATLIMLAWVHGCIGIFHWTRLKPWFVKARPVMIALAAVWPVLGYAGFISGARMLQGETEFVFPFSDAQFEFLKNAQMIALVGYGGFLALLVAVRFIRGWAERFQHRIEIAYSGGPTIRVPEGYSLLEASRLHDIPHASICGGRARCSTCRVRVLEGQAAQPLPNEAERRVLDRIGAASNVRLACQLRPAADISIATLLPARKTWFLESALYDKYYWGVEEKVTILFCDIRGFTALAEKRLPFDVVFILNQYLGRIGEVVEDSGGYVDKFIGDAVMAIFGIGKDAGQGAREALAAAKAIGGVLDALNQSLGDDLPEPLNVAMGIDTGTVILGRVGSADAKQSGRHITALGDIVNSASRLEAACRDFDVQLLVSMRTLAAAGLSLEGASREEIHARGKSETLNAVPLRRATAMDGAWTA